MSEARGHWQTEQTLLGLVDLQNIKRLSAARDREPSDPSARMGEGEAEWSMVALFPWLFVGESLGMRTWSGWRAVPIVNKLFGEGGEGWDGK